MKVLSSVKKVLITIMISLALIFLFLTSPHVYAGAGISQEVKKYHYECDDIYYSDGYFAHKATEYDSHLATLSILMAKYSMNPGGPDNKNDTKWYNEQSNRVKEFFNIIGFDSFEANQDYKSRTGFDTIGAACAKKQVGDYTVIGVTVRSGGYFLEWANNVYLGDGSESDYMHEGWYKAANKVLAHVREYIGQKHITGKIKLWMAGFSRGAAVTNIAAGLLDNNLDSNHYIPNAATLSHDDIYAYTFETPMGANINSKGVKYPKDEIYNNIFNVINPNDLVTKVAMKGYGFTRFGIDKYITTKLYDPENFNNNRDVYKKMYTESHTDYNEYHADDFEMRGVTGEKIAGILAGAVVAGPVGAGLTGYVISKVTGLTSVDNRKANYDSNIVTNRFLDELVNAIGSRANYCKTYQTLAKEVMLAFMSDDKTDKALTLTTLITCILINSYYKSVGLNVGGLIHKVFPEYPDVALDNVAAFVGVFVQMYVNIPNEIITLCMNIKNIFQNHGTDINVIHLECQDSYYIDAYNQKHETNLNIVNLRDNSELVHISFYGYNDLAVRNSKGLKLVDIEGYVLGRSDVKQCDQRFACGYYSYITEEKMELYLPINEDYKVSFKSYSKKLRHKVSYDVTVQYVYATKANPTSNGNKLPSGVDYAWFNSDRKEITINVRP